MLDGPLKKYHKNNVRDQKESESYEVDGDEELVDRGCKLEINAGSSGEKKGVCLHWRLDMKD
jgi:hypothetical protein